jgi:glycosyl transferase family 87
MWRPVSTGVPVQVSADGSTNPAAASESSSPLRRPPLWLAVAAIAAFWAAADSIVRWVVVFIFTPVHEDVRMIYVASEAGLRYGWSTIYDQPILRALSTSFPPDQRRIDNVDTYLHPPLVAWLFAPLTVFSEPVAYALWTLFSVAALVLAWKLAAPYTGLAKVSLLLLAIGLYSVLLVFYFGQPTVLVITAVAASWWFCQRDRSVAAGCALAVAMFLKPQIILLLPLALLVSGRIRLVAWWAAGCAVLATITFIVIGEAGALGWWRAIKVGEGDPVHAAFTLAGIIGGGPLTYLIWAIQGIVALAIARLQRANTDIVFAVGLLGSAATAFHFHELDYTTLVLAAWFILRTTPPLWHRLYLLAGIVPMQVMIFGQDPNPGASNLLWHAPILIWEAGWLAILAAWAVKARDAKSVPQWFEVAQRKVRSDVR